MRRFTALFLVAIAAGCGGMAESGAPGRPNIVFILADDLGYGELGCYGQKKILTPNIDRLATQGVRYTNAYAGSAVCAPSRCALMTGLHNGHAWVRDNRSVGPEGQIPIPASTITIAKLLKAAGYSTGAIGKWGLGGPGTEGDPNRQGFDLFFGFNCQGHAHNHYPSYLWKNDQRVSLPGNDGTYTGKQYSHDLFEAESLKFIEGHKADPFFLYVPFTIPHVALQVPDDSLLPYKDWEETPYWGGKGYMPHPRPRAAHAGMITRMDRSVGRILDLLKKLGLEENTVVFFTSDNGSIDAVGGHDLAFFEANGPLRGQKGQLSEGGIRVPLIIRGPGFKAGTHSDEPIAFCDMLPTLCGIAGIAAPPNIDGSDVSTLKGRERALYWEIPSGGGQQAVRMGKWKALRTELVKGPSKVQLFDLDGDVGETKDVALEHPDVVTKLERIMGEQHHRSELFPLKGLDGPGN
jgi:arylsulfatase A